MNYNVALAEDNSINRTTFLRKIESLRDVHVVFVAVNGHDCMEKLKGLPTAKIPQVIFMDLEMPEMAGAEAIRLCRALHMETHFIVLTVFDDEERIFEAIKAGASGYLLKHEPPDVLYEAIFNVVEHGGAPMSPAIARKTLQLMSRATLPTIEEKQALPEWLTKREREILEQMINGRDAKRIASALNISSLTVRKHISNIYEKLHVQSRAEVLTMAHINRWFG